MGNKSRISGDILPIILENRIKGQYYVEPFCGGLEIIKTDIGYDITINGEELGSYGIRKCEFLKWIYGTGCAEPRLSTLIKKYNGIS